MKLPRVTLRDLFWLLLVAACLCGWWAERRILLASMREAQEDAHQAQDDARLLSQLNDPTFEIAPWRMAELKERYGLSD
jgi:hypothetical protein